MRIAILSATRSLSTLPFAYTSGSLLLYIFYSPSIIIMSLWIRRIYKRNSSPTHLFRRLRFCFIFFKRNVSSSSSTVICFFPCYIVACYRSDLTRWLHPTTRRINDPSRVTSFFKIFSPFSLFRASSFLFLLLRRFFKLFSSPQFPFLLILRATFHTLDGAHQTFLGFLSRIFFFYFFTNVEKMFVLYFLPFHSFSSLYIFSL